MVVKFRVRILGVKNKKSLYSSKDPENLSEFLRYFKVASKINLFLLLSKRESPYISISFLSLSDKDAKLSNAGFTLFIWKTHYEVGRKWYHHNQVEVIKKLFKLWQLISVAKCVEVFLL